MNIEVHWDIKPDEIGINETKYDTYIIISININEETKEIWSVTYSYIWNCGSGCCSGTECDIAYIGQLSEELKKRILEKMPTYNLQGWKWQKSN
jgi:hypothetical protein